MEKDVFQNREEQDLSLSNLYDVDNFFVTQEVATKSFQSKRVRHINDFDNNIMQEDAYRNVENEALRLEYKINKTEEELKYVNSRIKAANYIGDSDVLEKLYMQKSLIENDLKMLMSKYNEQNFATRLSNELTNNFFVVPQKWHNNIRSIMYSFANRLMKLLPQKLTRLIEVKNTIEKLESINQNVDELMTKNIPYGEHYDKYQQLSKFIASANNIQSKITRELNK